MQNKFTVHCIAWYAGAVLINDIREAAGGSGLIGGAEKFMDDLDKSGRHAIAISLGGKLLGCARITSECQIDRIVILHQATKDRIETALIEILSDYAQQANLETSIVIKRESNSLRLAA